MSNGTKRISGVIHDSLYKMIVDIAEKENRSFNAILSVLLTKAVKEKNRKRGSTKKDNTEH